jgi:hypothetical protein
LKCQIVCIFEAQWCEQYRFRAVALVDGEDFGANQQPDKTVETLLAEYEQLILQQKEHQPDTPSCSADSGNLGSDVEVGLPLKLAILYLSHGGVSGGAAATVPSNDDDDGTTTSTTPKAHAAAAVFSLMEMAIHSYKQPEHANSAKMAVCKYNLSLYHLCHGSWLQATLLFGQALDIFDALDEFDHQELLFSLLPTLRQTHDFWPTLKRPIHVHRLPGESSMSFQIPVAAGEKEHATNDNASLAHHKFDSIKDASQNTGSSIPHVTTTTTPNQVAKVKGIITVANLDGGEQRQGQRAREEVIATLVLDVKQFLDQNKSVTA